MQQVTILSLEDWAFMFFVIVTIICLTTRRDALLPTTVGLIVVGSILKGSIIGGLLVTFNAILASTTDLLNIIIIIALVVMMTKTMEDMGSDRLMVAPLRGLLKSPRVSYWVIGFAMLILSWFIWPTPAVALLGALILPLAIVGGLPPMIAGLSLSIFGKGIALSSDFIIEGTPSVTAKMTGIPVGEIMAASIPVWATVSLVAATSAFYIAHKAIKANNVKDIESSPEMTKRAVAATASISASLIGKVMAWVIPLSLLSDVYFMFTLGLKGEDATALIGGTVLFITMISASFQYKGQAFSKVMDHARYGWTFAVKVFGPVVIIAGFFWLGGDSLKDILKDQNAQGLMFDWGYFIAAHMPLNTFMVSLMVTIASMLAAFDGSGYAAIPLGTSIAMALGKPIGANVAILAAQAQMAAIWTGATLIPWGFLAITASFVGVDPVDLARCNMWPTLLGLGAGVIVTAFLA